MNRGDRIQLLVKTVHKHFTPVLAPSDRTLLEHLLYACCLEDAPYDTADEAYHRLQESFFDWNEVRVTTATELIEHLQNLPDPQAAAMRIKKNLQSVFETRYCFDLQDMIKMNQGKAVAELEKFAGMTPFVLAFVTQNALGGHAIPVSRNILQVLLRTEIITEGEAEKRHVPGLDRGVPKNKGAAFGSCLHQLGVLLAASPKGKQTLAILREAGASNSEKKSAKSKESKQQEKTSADKSAKAKKETKAPQSTTSTTPPNKGSKAAAEKKPTSTKKEAGKSADSQPSAKKAGAKESPAPAADHKSSHSKTTDSKSSASKSPSSKTPATRNVSEKTAPAKRKPK